MWRARFCAVKMSFRFLPLSWQHYAACRDLFEDSFTLSEQPYFRAEWRRRCVSRSFVAILQGTVVAFALVDKRYKLQYICVNERFQGAKLGSRLLKKVLEACLTAGDRSIHLVTADDEGLMYWYSRFGFRVTGLYYEGDEFIGADMVRRARCRSATALHTA